MKSNLQVSNKALSNYVVRLKDRFFKILPMKEENQTTLNEYIDSLKCELIGANKLPLEVKEDHMFTSLLAILQFIHDEDCSTAKVKREVFKAIRICEDINNKIIRKV